MPSFNVRRHSRQAIKVKGNFRRGVGIALPVSITDLTPRGCCLNTIPRDLRRGGYVSLRIAGFGPIEGEVKWLRLGQRAGIEFYSPLHQAVFEHIITKERAANAEPDRPSEHLASLRNELEELRT